MFTHVFAGIPVANYVLARAWYERLIGRPPDLIPNDEEAAWQVSEAGWLCIVADVDRAGSAAHTVLVNDLDAFVAGLGDRGIGTGPVEAIDDVVRFTLITDPDGNRLSVGQPPSGGAGE